MRFDVPAIPCQKHVTSCLGDRIPMREPVSVDTRQGARVAAVGASSLLLSLTEEGVTNDR
jgi:hypothetical protein